VKNTEETQKVSVKDFTISESISGNKNWILFADSAIVKDTSYIIYGVRLNFLSENKDTISKLFSDSGVVFENSGNLTALSNVKVILSDTIKIFSDSLKWDNKSGKIIIEGNFKYISMSEEIEGEGMESDRFLKEVVIKKRIKGKGEYKR